MEKDTRIALNKLAREKTKLKLLSDIMFDLQVCELENLSKKEYIEDIINTLKELEVKQKMIEKWNGQLPTTTLNDNMLNLFNTK